MSPSSQQVESGQIKGILQQVKNDASPPSPYHSVSFRGHLLWHNMSIKHMKGMMQKMYLLRIWARGSGSWSITGHRPKITIPKLARFSDMVMTYALSVEVMKDSIPSTFREAQLSYECELWKNAMVEEIESLHINDTWELAELPKGKKVISCKWIFAKKEGSPNDIVCYKASLVVKSYA